MAPTIAFIWAMLCAPILIFAFLGFDAQIRFNYSLITQIVAPVVAAILCYITGGTASMRSQVRMVWKFLGTGILTWGVGAILFALYPFLHEGQETPYPWYSDMGYLLLVPFVLIAFIIFRQHLHTKTPLWGAIASVLCFCVTVALSIQFNLNKLTEADSLTAYTVTLLYVVGDPLLLTATVSIASVLAGSTAVRPWWLVLIGLVLYFFADLIYTYLSLAGQYSTGHPIDIGWPLGFGFIAVAAVMVRSIEEDVIIT